MNSWSAHSKALALRPLPELTPASPSPCALFSLSRIGTSFAFNHFRTLLHECENNQPKPPVFAYSYALCAKSDFLTPFLPCSSALFAKTWGVGMYFFPAARRTSLRGASCMSRGALLQCGDFLFQEFQRGFERSAVPRVLGVFQIVQDFRAGKLQDRPLPPPLRLFGSARITPGAFFLRFGSLFLFFDRLAFPPSRHTLILPQSSALHGANSHRVAAEVHSRGRGYAPAARPRRFSSTSLGFPWSSPPFTAGAPSSVAFFSGNGTRRAPGRSTAAANMATPKAAHSQLSRRPSGRSTSAAPASPRRIRNANHAAGLRRKRSSRGITTAHAQRVRRRRFSSARSRICFLVRFPFPPFHFLQRRLRVAAL
jgi:hypothetical protein